MLMSGIGPLGRTHSLPTGQHCTLLFGTCPCSGPAEQYSSGARSHHGLKASCPIAVNAWYGNSTDIASKVPQWTCQVSRVIAPGSQSTAPLWVQMQITTQGPSLLGKYHLFLFVGKQESQKINRSQVLS